MAISFTSLINKNIGIIRFLIEIRATECAKTTLIIYRRKNSHSIPINYYLLNWANLAYNILVTLIYLIKKPI